jgi:hypothetical protein
MQIIKFLSQTDLDLGLSCKSTVVILFPQLKSIGGAAFCAFSLIIGGVQYALLSSFGLKERYASPDETTRTTRFNPSDKIQASN